MSHRINEFNELPDVVKNMLLGFADARQEQIAENGKITKAFHRDFPYELKTLYKKEVSFYIKYVKEKYGNPFDLYDKI